MFFEKKPYQPTLEPCPCCGAEAFFQTGKTWVSSMYGEGDDQRSWDQVICPNCHLQTDKYFSNFLQGKNGVKIAAEIWNSRFQDDKRS